MASHRSAYPFHDDATFSRGTSRLQPARQPRPARVPSDHQQARADRHQQARKLGAKSLRVLAGLFGAGK
jgi:hypothetical protein